MMDPAVRYERWKAPAQDGQVLIWPNPPQLLGDARANLQHLQKCDSVLLQGVPLSELRRQMRTGIGHDDSQALLATGHQAELHHPGVWAKNALIDAAARQLGGRALHVAVDTDEPKHLLLRWPGGAAPLSDDPDLSKAKWSGMLQAPRPEHLAELRSSFAQAASAWHFGPVVLRFLQILIDSAQARSLPEALTQAMQQLDREFDLQYSSILVSQLCTSEAYLVFVYYVLSHACRFAADYNWALAQYRQQNKIKSTGRPMPDLQVTADWCEVPFWLDSLFSGARSRAKVVHSADRWVLRSEKAEEFAFDPSASGWDAAMRLGQWLAAHRLRLAPRALTLTAVLRLLVADQFVHGIGGGEYDQVLDALIARHLRIEPPRFSVTTATLYFPDALHLPRVCLTCLIREGHKLRHSVLGERKMELVGQIASSGRRSQDRAQLFLKMHEQLSDAWRAGPGPSFERRYRQAEQDAQQQQVLFDRELFYAIQSRERLTALIDQYRTAFSGQ